MARLIHDEICRYPGDPDYDPFADIPCPDCNAKTGLTLGCPTCDYIRKERQRAAAWYDWQRKLSREGASHD